MKSLDLVLSLNGIPVATVELKNPLTWQTVAHARQQYMTDRDPRDKMALEGLFIDRMEQNDEIATKFLNDKQFQDVVTSHLRQKVYDQFLDEAG